MQLNKLSEKQKYMYITQHEWASINTLLQGLIYSDTKVRMYAGGYPRQDGGNSERERGGERKGYNG